MRGDDTVKGAARISRASGEGLFGYSGNSFAFSMTRFPPRVTGSVATVVAATFTQDELLVLDLGPAGEVIGGAYDIIGNGASGLPATTIQSGSNFGYHVANAGDIDGDCYADLLVGARHDSTGGQSTGAVYILYMNNLNASTLVKGITKITIFTPGLSGWASSGDWLSAGDAIGDINGDGRRDLIVRQRFSGNGAVYVLMMGGPGPTPSPSSSSSVAASPSASPSVGAPAASVSPGGPSQSPDVQPSSTPSPSASPAALQPAFLQVRATGAVPPGGSLPLGVLSFEFETGSTLRRGADGRSYLNATADMLAEEGSTVQLAIGMS